MDKEPLIKKEKKKRNGAESPDLENLQPAVRETMATRIQRRARSLVTSAPARAISRIAQSVRNLSQRRAESASLPPRPPPRTLLREPPQPPPTPNKPNRSPRRKQRIECVRNTVSPSPSRSPPKRVDTPVALRPGSSNGNGAVEKKKRKDI